MIVGAAKGVIRTMLCNEKLKAQVIPVDWAIAGLIMFAYSIGTQKRKNRPQEISVICLNTFKKNQKTWGEALNSGRTITLAHPFEAGLWYPNGSLTTNCFAHGLKQVLFQWIPAYFLDFLLLCFGQTRL